MLTNKQIRFLKYVYKPKTIAQILKKFQIKNYLDINALFSDPISYFTYSDNNLDNDTIVSLTILGTATVDNERHSSKNLWLKSFWIPIIVSFVTTCLSIHIVPKLPLILKWFVHTLSKIFS